MPDLPYFSIVKYPVSRFGFLSWLKIRGIKYFFRAAKKAVFRYDLPEKTYREGMDFLTSILGYPGKRVRLESLKIGNMNAEWVIPDNKENERIILYMHGGAYNHGSIKSHRNICARLALECKSKVLAFEYRLAPEYPFPAALDDAIAVYSFLRLSGIDEKNIVFCGDSAGGGLCLATLLRLRENQLPLPLAAVCFSPWADLEASHPDVKNKIADDPLIDIKAIRIWGKKYADGMQKHHLVSPIYAQFNDLPPILIQIGEDEVLYYDTLYLIDKFKEANAVFRIEEYEEMIHVYQIFAGFLPQADFSLNNVSDFIERVIQMNPCPKTK